MDSFSSKLDRFIGVKVIPPRETLETSFPWESAQLDYRMTSALDLFPTLAFLIFHLNAIAFLTYLIVSLQEERYFIQLFLIFPLSFFHEVERISLIFYLEILTVWQWLIRIYPPPWLKSWRARNWFLKLKTFSSIVLTIWCDNESWLNILHGLFSIFHSKFRYYTIRWSPVMVACFEYSVVLYHCSLSIVCISEIPILHIHHGCVTFWKRYFISWNLWELNM